MRSHTEDKAACWSPEFDWRRMSRFSMRSAESGGPVGKLASLPSVCHVPLAKGRNSARYNMTCGRCLTSHTSTCLNQEVAGDSSLQRGCSEGNSTPMLSHKFGRYSYSCVALVAVANGTDTAQLYTRSEATQRTRKRSMSQ